MSNLSSPVVQKHRILFIPHSLNRLWRYLLLFDLVLWVLFWSAPSGEWYFAPPLRDLYLLYAAAGCLGLALAVFLIRNWGSVQAFDDHVRLIVPFYRLTIPLELIEDVRMSDFRKIFNVNRMSVADRHFLRHFSKEVVTTLHLKRYPRALGMRFFIPKYFFLPNQPGFIFPVEDYMTFNTQVDSRLNIQDGAYSSRAEPLDPAGRAIKLYS